MDLPFDAARLVRDARQSAGLTQRELARRAGTSQSVVARIETGVTDPSTGTLHRLAAAAGLELTVRLEAAPPGQESHMLDDVARILSLTPEERLDEVANVSRFLAEAKRG